MNNLEETLLNIGCSWQMSMLLPFLIILVIGFSVGFVLFQRLKSKILRSVLASLIGISLSGSYFAFYPVYVSDLNNEFRTEINVANMDKNKAFLEVLVIPDCPHCIYSTYFIKKLTLRNADAQIVYKIISDDGYGGGIEEKLKKEGMKYIFSEYNADIKTMAKGSFPSFVFHEKGAKEVQVWNNNTFGSKALDYIEVKLTSD